MPKWPISVLDQILISLATSTGSAILAFYGEEHHLFTQYARETPNDGQAGLAAFMGALEVSLVTFCGVFLFSLILQRVLTGSLSFKNN
jgi:hypothetical protein